MGTPVRLLATLLLATALLMAGCAKEPASGEPSLGQPGAGMPTPTNAIGTIVFDMGHGEIFGAQDTSELGQSQAIARMQAADFQVVINSDAITEEDLVQASGLVIAGPMTPLKDEEYAAITSFVERGGTVLLTIHVPFPVLKVPAHWGLPVATQIMMSQRPFANPAEPSVFIADQITDNPVTEGVSRVLVVSGWAVTPATETARIAVATSADTWVTSAGDQQPAPPADAQFDSFGVIGIAGVGAGRVIVSGDDAIFANLALGQADNARLLDNIIKVMSEMGRI